MWKAVHFTGPRLNSCSAAWFHDASYISTCHMTKPWQGRQEAKPRFGQFFVLHPRPSTPACFSPSFPCPLAKSKVKGTGGILPLITIFPTRSGNLAGENNRKHSALSYLCQNVAHVLFCIDVLRCLHCFRATMSQNNSTAEKWSCLRNNPRRLHTMTWVMEKRRRTSSNTVDVPFSHLLPLVRKLGRISA